MRSPGLHDHKKLRGRASRRIMRAVVATVLLPALSVVDAPAALADEFVLVRNVKNGTASASRGEIKDMSVGKRKTWASGAPVQLVLPAAGSPAMGWFASAVVGVSETALMSKIRQEVFKGELKKPISVVSDRDILALVAADPGAFGVVHADAAKTLPPDVVVLGIR